MGLLNFFKTNKTTEAVADVSPKADEFVNVKLSDQTDYEATGEFEKPIEIPEQVFVEYKRPNAPIMETEQPAEPSYDLNSLYKFLDRDLEKRGYEDALINPDTSFMQEHIKYLNIQLELTIARVKAYYGNYLREINFHIDTRRRSGMIETVEELLSHQLSVEAEVKLVEEIENDSKSGEGLCQNLFLSYQRGFKNGFAAITYNTILGKKNGGGV